MADGASSPHVILLAGPNGAGKSTVAPFLLHEALGIREFVNADAIAAGLSAFAPETVALRAGRLMLARMHELALARKSFAFETTLATHSFAPWLRELQQTGYRAHLTFLALPTPQAAMDRVQQRVAQGGHHVPDEVVERRFYRGLRNLRGLYMPIVDSWRLFDNAVSPPTLIAVGSRAEGTMVVDAGAWEQLERQWA